MESKSQSAISDNIIVGQHYPAIDGLRGFACLMVLWFHSSLFSKSLDTNVPKFYYDITLFGQTGVDLFFVLSGFLITGILMDNAYRDNVFRHFYIRRSLRIFPLYYAVLLIFALYVFMTYGAEKLGDFWLYLLYLQNMSDMHRLDVYQYLNHTWSLAVEEQFYLIWPFVFLSVYKKSIKYAFILCLSALLFSLGLRLAIMEMGYIKFSSSFLFSHLDGLVIGAALSVIFKHKREQLLAYRDVIKLFSALIVIMIAVNFIRTQDHAILVSGVQLTLVSLFFAAILMFMVTAPEDSILNQFFGNSFLRHIGQVSYGLYIFHVPIMNYMGYKLYEYQANYWQGHMAFLIIGGVISYIVSLLSFKLFEKKILKLKYKYAP